MNEPLGIERPGEVRAAECSINDLRDEIRDHYGHHQRHQGHALRSGLHVGKRLIRLKAKLPHGAFEAYVEKNFDFTARSARNYMRLAQEWEPKTESLSVLELDQGVQILAEDPKDKDVAPGKAVPFQNGTSAPPAPDERQRERAESGKNTGKVTREPGDEAAYDEQAAKLEKVLCNRCKRIGKPSCDKCRVKAYRITEGIEPHVKGTRPKKQPQGQPEFDWQGVFGAIKVIAQAPDKLRAAYGDCPQIIALDRLHKEYEEKRVKLLQDLQKRFT